MKFRKLLSTLLAAALVCGLACTAAFADEPADSTAETTVTTPSTPEPADPEPTEPADPVVTVEAIPAEGTAYASTQNITIDGKVVEFQAYALRDADGNDTNYVKLRDIAFALNGTEAQFEVGYDGIISVTTKTAYTAAGTEMTIPFSGDRAYRAARRP